MPKNLFQDMVKVNHNRKGIKIKIIKKTEKEEKPKEPVYFDREKKANIVGNGSRYMLWFVAFISLIFFFFAISYLFSKVTIAVNPKIQNLVLNENLSAVKDSVGDSLPFDLIVISGEENTTAQVSEKKDVTQRAEGIVLLYNTFSSSPQNLSIDTRLEGSNGKMYKTKTKTTIPGVAKDGTPGKVEVKIYADVAGPEYNSGPLDFNIFGFKGTPKYSKFYGRSKGEITGGLKGNLPFISEDLKANLINEMKISLEDKLFRKANDQIPAGFILFKDAVFLNIDDDSIDLSAYQADTLPIKLEGTLYGLLFNEEKLIQKIAGNNIKNYDGSSVYIPNIQNLKFALSDKGDIPFEDLKNINFNLSGDVSIVWKLDTKKFTSDLLDKSKKDFNKILLQYPNIDSADLSVRPFWKRSFPDKTESIEIIVNYPPHLSP